MPTTPHDATVFSEDDLYIKSPAETEAQILAEIGATRAKYKSHADEAVAQYEKLTGTAVVVVEEPEPEPAEEPEPEPAEEPAAPAAP